MRKSIKSSGSVVAALFVLAACSEEPEPVQPEVDKNKQKMLANLSKSVEELELSVRSYNCLKNANIQTISELVQKNDSEMLKTRNFGRKSLNEIREILEGMGLSLGMKLEDEDVKQLNLAKRKKLLYGLEPLGSADSQTLGFISSGKCSFFDHSELTETVVSA